MVGTGVGRGVSERVGEWGGGRRRGVGGRGGDMEGIDGRGRGEWSGRGRRRG